MGIEEGEWGRAWRHSCGGAAGKRRPGHTPRTLASPGTNNSLSVSVLVSVGTFPGEEDNCRATTGGGVACGGCGGSEALYLRPRWRSRGLSVAVPKICQRQTGSTSDGDNVSAQREKKKSSGKSAVLYSLSFTKNTTILNE